MAATDVLGKVFGKAHLVERLRAMGYCKRRNGHCLVALDAMKFWGGIQAAPVASR